MVPPEMLHIRSRIIPLRMKNVAAWYDWTESMYLGAGVVNYSSRKDVVRITEVNKVEERTGLPAL